MHKSRVRLVRLLRKLSIVPRLLHNPVADLTAAISLAAAEQRSKDVPELKYLLTEHGRHMLIEGFGGQKCRE
jgi:hypothetical protein